MLNFYVCSAPFPVFMTVTRMMPTYQYIKRWDDEHYQIEDIVSRGTSTLGRGGMNSKLAIARKVARLGTEVVIADGTDPQIMHKILGEDQAGTRFPVLGDASSAKRWLASADDHATGSVTANTGCGRSPAGQHRAWPVCCWWVSKP